MTDAPEATTAVFIRLIVDDAAAAIDFYAAAFDATEILRIAEPGGKIVHAEIQIGNDIVSLAESDGELNRSPSQLGGSPVIVTVNTNDVDTMAERTVSNGGEAIFPVEDREYGRRDGRYRDPEGHIWLIGQDSEALSNEEIQGRLDPGS